MKFMFIVKSAHRVAPTPALLEAMHKLATREIEAGRMLDNGGLMPLNEGAQVRIIGGELSVLDGPFAEAKEFLGGYLVLDCELERALEIAGRWPKTGTGGIEVRAVMNSSGAEM